MLWSSFSDNHQYTTGSARSASGKITGPWVVSPAILYGQDGGHAMLFKTFAGQLALSLHQPNGKPKERVRFFEVSCTEDVISLTGPLALP